MLDTDKKTERKVTGFICGGKPNHAHNNDWVFIETFDGSLYTGPEDEIRAELKKTGKREQTWSVACSICGSSAFGRDVYHGLE